jgi:carbamoyl-phosphate synthase/aspartate carbamoyltransferase
MAVSALKGITPFPISRTSSFLNDSPKPPVTSVFESDGEQFCSVDAVLELSDGSAFKGISFGAEGKSIAGECVFQTGKFCLPVSLSVPFMFAVHDQGWWDTRNP